LSKDKVEKYLGFYLPKPIWALSAPQLNPPQNNYTTIVSERVFSYELPNKFKIFLCRDGMFLLRINELAKQVEKQDDNKFHELGEQWAKYLKYANSSSLLFEASFLEIENLSLFEAREITNRDAFGVQYVNDKWSGHSCPQGSYAEQLQSLRFLSLIPQNAIPLQYNTKLSHRQIITKEVFDLFTSKLSAAFVHGYLIDHLELLNKALGEFKIGNFDTSIILSWFVIETEINRIWRNFIDENNTGYGGGLKRFNNKRRKSLIEDYTSSEKLNFIEIQGLVDFELFSELDKVRKHRNDIVHRNPRILNLEDGASAFNTAKKLLKKTTSFDFRANLGLSLMGL